MLYVSHNMNTIRQLCDRCVVMDEGKIIFDGDVEKAIELYTAVTPQKLPGKYIYDKTYHNDLWKHPDFTIEEMHATDRVNFVFDSGEDILLSLSVSTKQAFNSVKFRFEFSDMSENKLGSMWSHGTLSFEENEHRELNAKISSRLFTPGQYKVDIVAFLTDAFGEDHFLDGVYPGFYLEISEKINDANPFVRSVIQGLPNAVTFGFSADSDYYATDISFDNEGMPGFNVNHGGEILCRIELSVPGEHNILNALAAFACCHILGIDVDSIVSTLHSYTGIHRRFDVLGRITGEIRIIDDYAHHPTEIKATLAAIRNMKHRQLWCLFQPHTYTRTLALLDEFAGSFDDADKVVLAEIYAAREKNIYKISSKTLMNKILERDPEKDVYFFNDFEDIANFVYNNAQEGDLILTMGAGDIYRVGEMILELDR